MLELFAHNHETCLTYLNVTVPMLCTILLGIGTTLGWILWDDRRARKAEEYEKSQTEPEPLEIEEIPRKFLHFRKLCLQISVDSTDDHDQTINELVQWMNTNNHPNFTDIFSIVTDASNEYSDDPNITQWFRTALLVWSTHPEWLMPHIKYMMPRSRSWTVA